MKYLELKKCSRKPLKSILAKELIFGEQVKLVFWANYPKKAGVTSCSRPSDHRIRQH